MKPNRLKRVPAGYFRSVKKSTLLLCLLASFSLSQAFAQRSPDWRTHADFLVEQADSLSLRSQETFHLNRIIRVDKNFIKDKTVQETWYYTLKDNKPVIFQVRYLIDSTEFTESYYVNRGRLVCMEQYASPYFSKSDEVKWGQVLFYDNNNLKLYVSVGHDKPIQSYAQVGPDALDIFYKRYAILEQNLR